jgi:hypothetical protein
MMSEEQKKEEPRTGMSEILKAYPNAPSQEQIEQWKMQFGEVFVSGFSDTELFIWRAVNRPEWVRIQMKMNDPEAKMDQFKFEELICDTCILWKSVSVTWDTGKAGTPGTLQEQILQQSNFYSPQQAAMLVAKL